MCGEGGLLLHISCVRSRVPGMDTRAARRAAEKAARDLINNRAALIGELGVARAERTQLDADVATAVDRGRQLIAEAPAEAARLLEDAQTCVRDADQRYADVYSATTAASWTPADLTALGFPAGQAHTALRRRPAVARSAGAQPPTTTPATAVTVPLQQTDLTADLTADERASAATA